MNTKWNDYYIKTKTGNPRPLLIRALKYVKNRNFALDLGCGVGNDTIFLQENNFLVTSVDSSPAVKKYLSEAIISTFADFSFPVDKYDIVNAEYSLPFNPPETFFEVFSKLTNSLKSGGIFVGQFFGNDDEWLGYKNMTFHTKAEVLELLKPYEVHFFKEIKENRALASGDLKFWHLFNIIAERR